jgi:hypothetical protein
VLIFTSRQWRTVSIETNDRRQRKKKIGKRRKNFHIDSARLDSGDFMEGQTMKAKKAKKTAKKKAAKKKKK